METHNLPSSAAIGSSPQPEPTLTVDRDELRGIMHGDGGCAELRSETQSCPSPAVSGAAAPEPELRTLPVDPESPYNIINAAFLITFQETQTIEQLQRHTSHKTEEEKAALKKLKLYKNRMAGRASRKRKKAYLKYLVEKVTLLEDQISSLREERCMLKGFPDAETANRIAMQESDPTTSPPLMAAQDSCPRPPSGDTDLRPPMEDTDFGPTIGDTDLSPPMEDTDFSPPMEETELRSPIGDTDLSPPMEDTELSSPIGDTDLSPPMEDEELSPPIGNTDLKPPIRDADPKPPMEDTEMRERRLLKNREAVRKCRQKKKEACQHLHHRKVSLQNQSQTLLQELQSLKAQVCKDVGTGGVPTMSLHSQKEPDMSTWEDLVSFIYSHNRKYSELNLTDEPQRDDNNFNKPL